MATAQMTSEELLGSAISALSAPLPQVPNAAGASTSGMKGALKEAKTRYSEAADAFDINRLLLDTATKDLKGGVDAEVSAKQGEVMADRDRSQAVADVHQTSNNIYGIGLKANDRVVKLAMMEQSESDKALGMLDSIRAKQNVSPLDNIIDWAAWQLNGPAETHQYNTTVAKVDVIRSIKDKAMVDAKALADAEISTIPTITAAKAKSQFDMAAAMGMKAKALADIELAKLDSTMAHQILSSSLQVFQAEAGMNQAEMANAQAKWARDVVQLNLAQSEGERLHKAAALSLQMDEIKADKAVLAMFKIKTGINYSPGEFKMMPPAVKEEIIAAAHGSFGATPGSTLNNMSKFPIGENAPAPIRKTLEYLNGIRQKIALTSNEEISLQGKNKAEADALISGKINKQVADDVRTVDQNTTGYWALPSYETVAAMRPELRDTQVYKVFKQLEQAGNGQPPKLDMVLQTLLNESGSNPNVAAAQMYEYTKALISARNAAIPFRDFGLRTDTPGLNDVALILPGRLMGNQQFNMSDFAQVQAAAVYMDRTVKMRTQNGFSQGLLFR